VGFVWVRAGFEYRLEFITRLCMTLSVPALIFTALMKTEIDPAALTSVLLAAVLAYGVLTLAFWGLVTTVLGSTGAPSRAADLWQYRQCRPAAGAVRLWRGRAWLCGRDLRVMAVWSFTFGVWLVAGGGSPARCCANRSWSATLLGALFLWQGWQTPVWLTNSLDLIGQIAIPLMLITLGVAVARLNPGRLGRRSGCPCCGRRSALRLPPARGSVRPAPGRGWRC
jgi:malate permease and related proteins